MSVPATTMNATPTLAELLKGLVSAPDIAVAGIASDSRKLQPGFLFLACRGANGHGLDYLEQARAAGACAVVWDAGTAPAPSETSLPMIAVDGLAGQLGEIANRFYGYPSRSLKVIGITGTNGKTTVAWLLAAALQHLDRRCGYVGTLGAGIDDVEYTDGMTTPPAVELHAYLADFVDAGAAYAALEVSSHALSQRRPDGVAFDTAVFTNLTRDHLDYHGDMTSYFEAKTRLFLDCPVDNRVVNLDTEFGTELASRCGQEVVTVSTNFDRVANGRPYVFVRSVVASPSGSDICVTSSWGDRKFTLPLPGDFNVANAATVLACLLVAGIELERACDVLEIVSAPPGRMQKVAGANLQVYIDYAHTPNAIESALRALRPHCRGKLWCVFGCGGDRDSGKRPMMAKLAERLADRIVITSDNPRDESPQQIMADMAAGLSDERAVALIEDRGAAIAWAIANAAPADVVLVAGKGHEHYQEMRGERYPFSDYAIASAAITARADSA